MILPGEIPMLHHHMVFGMEVLEIIFILDQILETVPIPALEEILVYI
jgi:hypothetical protein